MYICIYPQAGTLQLLVRYNVGVSLSPIPAQLAQPFIILQVPTVKTGALSRTAWNAPSVPAGVKKMASMRTIDDCGLHSTPCVSKSELKNLYIVHVIPMA